MLTTKSKRLLVVDDESDLCEILQFNLSNEGYIVDIAYSAEEALSMIPKGDYSLILLDVMMEGISGFKMAEKLKNQLKLSVPIIFLTARDTENDMLTGFSLGADDFISKPFSVKEVIARIRAVLRRVESTTVQQQKLIKIEGLIINISDKIVALDGEQLQLTRKEFDILALLASVPNRTFTRGEILDKVWGIEVDVLERTIDVHITRLRKKIGVHGTRIINRSNYGYSFNL